MLERMRELTVHHSNNCPPYAAMLRSMGRDGQAAGSLDQVPFLPASIFKMMRLSSLERDDNIRIQTSSGTSGQESARIVLDAQTRSLQQEALASIGSDFLGKKRLPMLVIDTESVIRDKRFYTARTSAILGFSIFGRDRTFVLREDYSLDTEVLDHFLQRYGDRPFLVFGFTFLVYRYFLQVLEEKNIHPDLSCALLVHGGGWKKLASQAVSKEEFAARLKQQCGIDRVTNYYGMAEQTGSIFMECPCGHLHCSDYSAVLVRDPADFSVCEKGKTGLLQVMSVVQRSYPGHSILTEDLGRILGEDDCPCRRKGVYFEVLGRAEGAQLRGCSDTFSTGQALRKEEGITFLTGSRKVCDEMPGQAPWAPFAERTLQFLSALSGLLMKAGREQKNAEITTFAFWCRQAGLRQMSREWYKKNNGEKRTGRGVSFHIAPGNIPLQFAYSMAAALLAGNCVILCLPDRQLEGQQAVIEALNTLLEGEYADFASRTAICRFGHNERILRELTALCNVRVLWGSDASINTIRLQAPAGTDVAEIVFPARDSSAMLSAEYILSAGEEGLEEVCRAFYNDTFLMDQNACASPHLLCWQGEKEKAEAAAGRFWKTFSAYLDQRGWELPAQLAVEKYASALQAAAEKGSAKIMTGHKGDMRIVRVQAEKMDSGLWQYSRPGGFFLEFLIRETAEMAPMMTRRCQTLTVCGMDPDEVKEVLTEAGCIGPNRIVPFGKALAFDLYWDGHDLIREMTRQVTFFPEPERTGLF